MSDILLNAEEKMMGVIDNLESNLRQIRTGRASGQMLERVQVEYYGAMTPINQMAQISVVEGTQLVIKPYDRSIIKDIAHAIQAANLGLKPQAEADVIRILVPQLTEDRRKELAKDAQKYGFGVGYVYSHENPEVEQQFLPDELIGTKYTRD